MDFKKEYEQDSCGAMNYEEFLECRLMWALQQIGLLENTLSSLISEEVN